MTRTQVTTWYLEMPERQRLRAAGPPNEAPSLVRAEIASPEFGRFLYRAVGANWCWTERLAWTDERWRQQLEETETWVAYVRGTPAGFFELRDHGGERVDIALLGLLPWAIGRGIGRWLLTRAVERAWDLGPRTVTVNTCSLDGPHALANYRARGFEIVRTVVAEQVPNERREDTPG
jgi:GNAT superfamily N-acetyltransferase